MRIDEIKEATTDDIIETYKEAFKKFIAINNNLAAMAVISEMFNILELKKELENEPLADG